MIDAELFGCRPGVFTGANCHGAHGRLREVNGGTLFLDEIGDMPLALQACLLRVLQERQLTPLDGDFRLLCASHHQLKAEVAAAASAKTFITASTA